MKVETGLQIRHLPNDIESLILAKDEFDNKKVFKEDSPVYKLLNDFGNNVPLQEIIDDSHDDEFQDAFEKGYLDIQYISKDILLSQMCESDKNAIFKNVKNRLEDLDNSYSWLESSFHLFDFDCNIPLSDVGCEVFINSELKINNNASEHNHDGLYSSSASLAVNPWSDANDELRMFGIDYSATQLDNDILVKVELLEIFIF